MDCPKELEIENQKGKEVQGHKKSWTVYTERPQETISLHDPLALHSSGWVCHQVDRIHCCPTLSLCQLAVRSGLVNTTVSIFHHTVTPGQAEKWLNMTRLKTTSV